MPNTNSIENPKIPRIMAYLENFTFISQSSYRVYVGVGFFIFAILLWSKLYLKRILKMRSNPML